MGMGDGRTDVWELWRTPAWHRGGPRLDAFVTWLCRGEDEHVVKVQKQELPVEGPGRVDMVDGRV